MKNEFAKPKIQSDILNWLIEGYSMLNHEGLTHSVKVATAQYEHDSDKMVLFMEDCCMEQGD